MAGDDDVWEGQESTERIVTDDRAGTVLEKNLFLFFVDVQTERANLAALERINDGQGVDQGAPAGVDEHGAIPHQFQSSRIDHMFILWSKRAVQCDQVRLLEQFIKLPVTDT